MSGWDWKSEPTGLTDGEDDALRNWRNGGARIFPLTRGGATGTPGTWIVWLANQREDIEDRNLTAALAVAAHGFLRGRAGVERLAGSDPDAPTLGSPAAMTVLREVVDCLDRKLRPSPETLEVWDDHDAGEGAVQRRAPSAEKRADWAREARVTRLAGWLKLKRMSEASRRHVESDVRTMIMALGIAPKTGEVDRYLSGHKQSRRLRWAWKLYVRHRAEKRDRLRPGAATPGASGRPPISAMAMPPSEMCAAIRVLAAKFTVTGLHKLRVSDYRGDGRAG